MAWLQTGAALPVMRADKSVPLTVGRRPAVVHDVETLSQLALIARHGPAWFRSQGTPEAPGSTLVTASGAVRRPGVLEIALGTPIIDILNGAGLARTLSAVLVGGYGGAWLAPSRLDTPYAPGPLAALGTTHGVGVLIALPRGSCGIAETARIARYMAGQSTRPVRALRVRPAGHRRRPGAAVVRPGRCLLDGSHQTSGRRGRRPRSMPTPRRRGPSGQELPRRVRRGRPRPRRRSPLCRGGRSDRPHPPRRSVRPVPGDGVSRVVTRRRAAAGGPGGL